MTTLNTIIEEEKKKCDDLMDSFDDWVSDSDGDEYYCPTIDKEKVKDHLTTAMQRAYEAGRAEDRGRIKSDIAMSMDFGEYPVEEGWPPQTQTEKDGWNGGLRKAMELVDNPREILSKITHKTPQQ